MSRRGFVLSERDFAVLHEVSRWRFCLSRQIKELCGFSDINNCNKRLNKLVNNHYLEKKHILYGIPYLYYVGKYTRYLSSVSYYVPKIKNSEIRHNIAVIDSAIFFHKVGIDYNEMISERELHSLDGFGSRKHHPDIVIQKGDIKICVEVEFTPKAKVRFENILRANRCNYDLQIWIVPRHQKKIRQMIHSSHITNIKVIDWNVIEKSAKRDK